MTPLEKQAFEHGMTTMLKIFEGCAYGARKRGKTEIADFLLGLVERAEEDVPDFVKLYSDNGFDYFMRLIAAFSSKPEE